MPTMTRQPGAGNRPSRPNLLRHIPRSSKWDQPLVVVGSGSYGRDVGVLNLTTDVNEVQSDYARMTCVIKTNITTT